MNKNAQQDRERATTSLSSILLLLYLVSYTLHVMHIRKQKKLSDRIENRIPNLSQSFQLYCFFGLLNFNTTYIIHFTF